VIKVIFLLKTTGGICHDRGADDDGGKRTDPSIPEILDLPPPHTFFTPKIYSGMQKSKILYPIQGEKSKAS
jgi:hypothetical protein